MNPSDLASYAEVLAIVGGGVWAYWRFVRQRDRHPRVTLTAHVEQVAWHGTRRLVRVSVDVRNDGSVRLVIPKMWYTLRTIRAGDMPVDGDDAILGQPVFAHVEVRRRPFTHPRHEYSFVDAGSVTRFSSLAYAHEDAAIATAKVTLRYRDPDSDFHTAADTIELPVRSPPPAGRRATATPRATRSDRTDPSPDAPVP